MFWDKVQVYAKHEKVAEYKRVKENKRARVTDPKIHPPIKPKKQGPCKEEKMLIGYAQSLDRYVAELKKRSRGRGVQPLRRLLNLKRTYPEGPFLKAIDKSLHYKMYNLSRLEDLIINFVKGDFFNI